MSAVPSVTHPVGVARPLPRPDSIIGYRRLIRCLPVPADVPPAGIPITTETALTALTVLGERAATTRQEHLQQVQDAKAARTALRWIPPTKGPPSE